MCHLKIKAPHFFIAVTIILFFSIIYFLESDINFVFIEKKQPEHTFLITVDGLRADYLDIFISQFPDSNMSKIINFSNTRYSTSLRTVCPSVTTVAHASLFTGMEPGSHQYYSPGDDVLSKTIFEVLEDSGYKTALIDGKGGRILGLEKGVSFFMSIPDMYDSFILDKNSNVDMLVMEYFIDLFNNNTPSFSFVLLPGVDYSGHTYGHESLEYFDSISKADDAIGILVEYLTGHNLFEKSALIIVSDHGMTGFDHGDCFPNDLGIFVIRHGNTFSKKEIKYKSILDIKDDILGLYKL